jgi:hypothetical protein
VSREVLSVLYRRDFYLNGLFFMYNEAVKEPQQLRAAFDRRLGGTHFKLQAKMKESTTKTEMHWTYLR